MAERLPIALKAYRLMSLAAAPLVHPLVARRLKKGKEDAARVAERRGVSSRERPEGALVWIHGASVGEVLAAASLIQRLRQLGFRVLLTSGTVTSAAIAARRFSSDVIHQFVPFDSPKFVRRFLDHWQPDLALFMESDIWPNLILETAARRVPAILLNGRLSERSFTRWQKLRDAIGLLLSQFDLCLAQSKADAERFSELGAQRVAVSGNLKLDVAAPPADPERLDRLMAVVRGRPIIAAASTHPGEEEVFADAHHRLRKRFPALLTIIAPRHPHRGEAIAQMAAASGLRVALRSLGHLPAAHTDIYVADTMGELGLIYRVAPVVFMGGSIARHGGQNPIEAIKLGAAVLHGPHVWNFADLYRSLDKAGGAIPVPGDEELIARLALLLDNRATRAAVAQAGGSTVAALGGALDRTLAAIEPYLAQLRLEAGAHHA